MVVQLVRCAVQQNSSRLVDTDVTLGDSTVRVSLEFEDNYFTLIWDQVWSVDSLEPLYIIDPHLETGAGDLFSLSWSSTLQTIFVGCQNTSLQWYNFQDAPAQSNLSPMATETPSSSGLFTPSTIIASRKAHKFFDSYPQYEHKPADLNANNGTLKLSRRGSPTSDLDFPPPREYLEIPISNVIDSAHYGYVYCMTILKNDERVRLATGSGDETVKVIFIK